MARERLCDLLAALGSQAARVVPRRGDERLPSGLNAALHNDPYGP